MATVTPPLRGIAEPPTPRHGPKYDNHEPYLRRRSSRLKSLRTPSPSGIEKVNKQKSTHKPQNYHRHLSPPSSPISPSDSSPRRRSRKEMQPTLVERNLAPKSTERMLPTPIKTPAKVETKRNTKTTSRVLFPQGLGNDANDILPQRNRVSLNSPGSTPRVEVFTDMNARIPELDESDENVFYDAPHKRTARARARAMGLEKTEEKRKELTKDHNSDKGMWFTFRGKKVWREYEVNDQDQEVEDANASTVIPARQATPPPRFTKTAYQPRTLFPEAYKKGDTTDEEAVTDIEHPEKHEGRRAPDTLEKPAATPAKQRFYATPPTTARTTRSTAKRPADDGSSDLDELSTSLFIVKKGKRTSPFNEWTRVKGDSISSSHEKKRRADEPLSPGDGKRVRGNG